MREAMMEEAIDIIRKLWKGETLTYRGEYYTLENARIYTLPEHLPPILMAAGGPRAAESAGRIADGLITTTPSAELLYVHQVGPDQGGFFRFYEQEILPKFR
jgi:coenzyme F420-dependent glucose-6-phosphate dehydrogenase